MVRSPFSSRSRSKSAKFHENMSAMRPKGRMAQSSLPNSALGSNAAEGSSYASNLVSFVVERMNVRDLPICQYHGTDMALF